MNQPQRCFVCKTNLSDRHFFYLGLCGTCGDLNYAKRNQSADLRGFTALVTGARVKIGYAVTLKLLRSGAFVIATTRFPHDAARRYSEEVDFSEWKEHLHVYELDLRNLSGVDRFAAHLRYSYPRLDIIVNNAAQTIRRPAAFYEHLLEFESLTLEELPPELQPLVARSHTFPLARVPETFHSFKSLPDEELASNKIMPPQDNINLMPLDFSSEEIFFPVGMYDRDRQQLDLRPFNTWLMKDDEVSLLELLEVHVINALAPFVLNSRLKSLMAKLTEQSKYIINISSMEGRFNGVDKPWRHPHTNMAKAALNQMTRTCAKEYAKYRIYMNAVDPGWISFQHPYPQAKAMQERGVSPPFDIFDAAARICDPIYSGINGGCFPFGKLFKDYAESQW